MKAKIEHTSLVEVWWPSCRDCGASLDTEPKSRSSGLCVACTGPKVAITEVVIKPPKSATKPALTREDAVSIYERVKRRQYDVAAAGSRARKEQDYGMAAAYELSEATEAPDPNEMAERMQGE